MGRKPVVHAFVRGAHAVDVKHDVGDEKAEKDRQPCDQSEPCKHPREKDKYRMPGTQADCEAFDGTVVARFENGYTPITRPVRDGAVPFKSCAHRACLPRSEQG